ncbi:hypothetical protein BJ322DRAFT_419122 [Thelephora terrestris]|uniref:Uncharacterized protein n=1 Tax=Thelephora terrestris TaxID=56493 RepID=A0A9P6LBR1_9AGAM|nr:hypothetical protein BJ322DRAFT_419122 [Thelephora terrestris]
MGNRLCTRLARVPLISVLALMVCFDGVNAVNLQKCGARLQAAQGGALNTTSNTSPAPVLRLSYEECIVKCGGGVGDVSWQAFSQSFGTWFLPWIALAFQIPFGAEYPLEDVLNFFMTIGSPALAAYSLQITNLNAGWLSKAFVDLKYPNSGAISAVISAFQHVPIHISSAGGLLPSLIVLPQNDAYWKLLLNGVKKTRRWSIPLVAGFVWVVVATLLTIIDSFYSPPTDDVGYSIVATWTYLLPIILGWLYVGSQPEPNHLRECLESANGIAWVATDQKYRPVRAKDIAGRHTQAIELMKAANVDRARMDELKTIPVFNYARTFIWSLHAQLILSYARNAADKVEWRIPVDNHGPGRGAEWVKGDSGDVEAENRLGSEEQVIRYCTETFTPFEKVFGVPSPIISPSPVSYGGHTPNLPVALLPFYNPGHDSRGQSRWAVGIWGRVALAVLFALGLQWGTVGSAIAIHYWKSPVGLGCRSLSFLLYGVVATASMFFCLASSVLAHISRPLHGPVHQTSLRQMYLDGGAVLCGYLGKTLAFASGIGIMIICSFQSSGVYDNCYCASTTFDRGVHDVVLLAINYTIGPGTIRAWIGGLVFAFSTAVLFGFSLYLGTPPRR